MTERAYFDWNATAPLRPEARAAMMEAFGLPGNPSSIHAEGRAARRTIEVARGKVAALVGADPAAVTFTSGGTEANALALSPHWSTTPYRRLLVSAVEHPSVLAGGRFAPADIEQVPVTADGVVDLAALAARLRGLADQLPLVSVMLANNESGVIQPVSAVAQLVHEAGGLLHVDAVQAVGRVSCDIKALGADLLTLSAHKIGGPKGVGALVRRTTDLHPQEPLMRGGGQERGLRAGTENVAAIAGFGAVAAAIHAGWPEEATRMRAARDRLESEIRAVSPQAVIFGENAERLPNTTLFTIPGLKAETAIIALDLDGVALSSGAACSSGKVQPSHVLTAMGVAPDLARGALRVSLGATTTESDIQTFVQAWKKLSESLLKRRTSIAA
ncbi:MAG: cysteine desulfurase family protein [Pseudorhodoplanes sp.]